MALTDTAVRKAKPKEKPYKVADERGMYLEIMPNGSKYWRMKYRHNGKEKRLALGRRTQATVNGETTTYLYDGMNVIAEMGAKSAQYLRTDHIDEAIARYSSQADRYFLTDLLGSTLTLTDRQGNATTTYSYSPFGETEHTGQASDNPAQYTGREHDGTGLYYYRARYYAPGLARFISSDPIGLAGGLNTYAYVLNNPLRWTDPRGLDITGDWESVGGIRDPMIPYGLPGSTGSPCGSGFTFPAFSYGTACIRHDECYDTCGANKTVCDFEFLWNMQRSCRPGDSQCLFLAQVYFTGVLHGGHLGSYRDAQEKACKGCKK